MVSSVKEAQNFPSYPAVPDWQAISLTATWPDKLNLRSLTGWKELLRVLSKKRKPLQLPPLPELATLPKYLLQEFHNLPNGNYSNRFTRGYINGFDRAMMGQMRSTRRFMANCLQHCSQVLDIGTGGGRTAQAMIDAGIDEVWGLDPSPYLLQHAARDCPQVKFIHGIAERLPFADNSLDGISICFVFHEVPPKYIKQALAECYRVLRPNGQLVIAEPSPEQLTPMQLKEFFSLQGYAKLYFKWLANHVYEPFLAAWHKLDKPSLFNKQGFTVLSSRDQMPILAWQLRVQK